MVHKKIAIILSTLASLMTIGCTTPHNSAILYPQAPMAENFEPSYQKQLNASAHWGAIASDMADQLSAALNKNNIIDKPVYINLYSEKTEFSKAFHDFLTTSLVKKGVLVSKNKIGSTIYNYKVQPIKYNSNRTTTFPSKIQWTTLAAGLIVIREAVDLIDDKDGNILAAGVLADIWSEKSAPKLELIISTSVLSRDIYVLRTTDVYYANSEDMHFYMNQSQLEQKKVFDDPFYQMKN